MAVTRLDSDERRNAIVGAAVPLFARKGFAGTTTRELAEAAGISEALLFRHFPSKQSLYREILSLGCKGDPPLEELASLQPSTATLVCMVRFMVRRFLLGAEDERAEFDPRLRLLLHSFLEDGDFARELFEAVCGKVVPLFEASLNAATAAGDVVARPDPPANRFWFAQHVAAMLAFAVLPGESCVPYRGSLEDIVTAASHFILRGIGMTDAAIATSLGAPEGRLQSAAD